MENRARAEERTDRHLRRATAVFVMGAVLSFAANVYIQWHSAQGSNEPRPPVVAMALAFEEENPALCPGDTLRYTLTIDVTEPSVVDIDRAVRNLDTGRSEIFSETQRAIYDQAGVVILPMDWALPRLMPATPTRSARAWQPGQYRQLVALTGAEGDRRAAVASVDFQIRENCQGGE